MRYKNGDLLEATEMHIAHGCNCKGVMGSGVALAIKNKWPEIFEIYKMGLEDGAKLGDVIIDNTPDEEKIILNLLTQEDFGRDGKRYVNYAAIVSSLVAYMDTVSHWDAVEIAIPRIGSGLGKGDWNIIETLLVDLENVYENLEFIVYDI